MIIRSITLSVDNVTIDIGPGGPIINLQRNEQTLKIIKEAEQLVGQPVHNVDITNRSGAIEYGNGMAITFNHSGYKKT